jgi:acyl dehydratase
MTAAKRYWEDFIVGVVTEYGPHLVTAEEITAFADEFDPQPMHRDETAARATVMGGLCASGWHTCCLMMRMIADGFILRSSSMGTNGIDEIKWLVPVRPGDRLTVRAHVLDRRASRSRPEMGLVTFLFEVVTGTGTCVMTLTASLMFGRAGRDQSLCGALRSATLSSR